MRMRVGVDLVIRICHVQAQIGAYVRAKFAQADSDEDGCVGLRKFVKQVGCAINK